MGHAGLLVLQFFERFVDAFLAEGIDRQVLHYLVVAAITRHGKTKHGVFRNSILPVRGDTHGDPFALGA